jgi:hypothetical protein
MASFIRIPYHACGKVDQDGFKTFKIGFNFLGVWLNSVFFSRNTSLNPGDG